MPHFTSSSDCYLLLVWLTDTKARHSSPRHQALGKEARDMLSWVSASNGLKVSAGGSSYSKRPSLGGLVSAILPGILIKDTINFLFP